jgi:hypothetical protein
MWKSEIQNSMRFKPLQDAINIHIGDVNDIDDMTKSIRGCLMDMDSIRLPYDNTLITYTDAGKIRRAAHIVCENEYKYIYGYFNYKPHIWSFSGFEVRYKKWDDVRIGMVDGSTFGDDHYEGLSYHACNIIWLTCYILNSKNIYQQEILPPQKVNAKRIRKGKLPLYSYKVLNVKLFGTPETSSIAQYSDPLNHNRLHLCRGHFKEFTDEKPLFGKYTGLFWWQPTIRGQNKKGFVNKDYLIQE